MLLALCWETSHETKWTLTQVQQLVAKFRRQTCYRCTIVGIKDNKYIVLYISDPFFK